MLLYRITDDHSLAFPHEWQTCSHVKLSNVLCSSNLWEFRSISVQEQLSWSLALSQKQHITQPLDLQEGGQSEPSPPCHSTSCRVHGSSLNVSLLKQRATPYLSPLEEVVLIPLQQLSMKILCTNFVLTLLNTPCMSKSPYPVLKRWQ